MVCWLTRSDAGFRHSRCQRSPCATKLCCSSCDPWISRIRSRSPGYVRIISVSGSPVAATGRRSAGSSGSAARDVAANHSDGSSLRKVSGLLR